MYSEKLATLLTVYVDIFVFINFHGFDKIDNFPRIEIHVLILFDLCAVTNVMSMLYIFSQYECLEIRVNLYVVLRRENGNAGPKLHWLVWEKIGFSTLPRERYFLAENKGRDGDIWAKLNFFSKNSDPKQNVSGRPAHDS